MGYTTEFEGRFEIDPFLSPAQVAYLKQFSGTRRMKRDPAALPRVPDPRREEVGLPVGEEGAYCVLPTSEGVVDPNSPPAGQPNLWCQWVPTDDGHYLEWDGGEKFYNYVEWLEYLIEHFFSRWGCVLNGEVHWHGETIRDHGTIVVADNSVVVKGKPRA